MAIFGVEFDSYDNGKIYSGVDEIRKNLKDNNLVKNPFTGGIVQVNNCFLFNIKPIYFNFTPFFIFPIVFIYYFMGLSWLLIIPICLMSLGFFWSKYFFYLMFKLKLRKIKYNGKVKLISDKKMLEVSYDYVAERYN